MKIEGIASEIEDEQASVSLYRILSYPADYTLEVLYSWWQQGDVVIPPFQRRFVWTHRQASRLIESFLMGLPVPELFIYKDKDEKILVIDGQQRLRSVFAFLDGIFPDGKTFSLEDVAPNWLGKTFQDLDPVDGRRFRSATLRTITVDQIDPADDTSIYHIFERLNTGGTILSPQEVRNCVAYGPFSDFLNQLNTASLWRDIMGSPQVDKRFRDVELILRFFALLLGEYKEKPMKDFLTKFMRRNRNNKNLGKFRELFEHTCRRVVGALGPKPFHVRRGLNAAAYDSVMCAFASSEETPSDIKRRYARLLDHSDFAAAITAGTTDIDTVASRIGLAKKILFES